MRLRQDYLKESPGQYAHGECYRKHFFVPHKLTVHDEITLCDKNFILFLYSGKLQ